MKNLFAITALLLLVSFSAYAKGPALNYSAFRMLPVLQEGRVKPLDTYARLKLEQFSGSEKNAAAWLAETLFDPVAAGQKPLFFVPSKDIRQRLGLDTGQKYFTLAQVQNGLNTADIGTLLDTPLGNLTPEQKQILQLQENVLDYNRMLHSFSLLLPLDFGNRNKNYLQLASPDLLKKLKILIKRKGANPDRYTESEKHLAELVFGLQQIRSNAEGNDEFRVIPVESLNGERVSPWQSALQNKNTDALKNWKAMAIAYRNDDAAAWSKATKKTLHESGTAPVRFALEILYNTIKPFHLALMLYGLSFVFLVGIVARPHPAIVPRPGTGLSLLGAGLIAHLFGILTRIIVLGRPPVGTLYEAVLFVSFICAAVGFVKRNSLVQLPGLIAAILLLSIAPALLQPGDSMEMLVAVLNTNFWLSTHVLCITGGYALSILTACLAHIYLAAAALNKKPKTLKMLQQNIYGFSIVALLLTAVGTALGGIWADQSWGRFWGWDPKENGALLIVLWLAWLQHGRLGNKLSPLNFAAATAFLNVIVALAWFGVNLLSVGLHSYGFTSGIAAGLALFCAAEISIIGTLWFYIRKQNYAY